MRPEPYRFSVGDFVLLNSSLIKWEIKYFLTDFHEVPDLVLIATPVSIDLEFRHFVKLSDLRPYTHGQGLQFNEILKKRSMDGIVLNYTWWEETLNFIVDKDTDLNYKEHIIPSQYRDIEFNYYLDRATRLIRFLHHLK